MTRTTESRVIAVLAAVSFLALTGGIVLAGVAAEPGAESDAGTTTAIGGDASAMAAIGGDAPIAQTGGQVRGSPALDLLLSQPTVPTGGPSTVTVDLLNTGEMDFGNELDPRVTTARSLRLEAEADDDDPIEVTSDEIAVGDVPTGAPTSVPIEIAVPDDTPDGEYELEVTARYRFTSQINPEFTNHNDRRGIDRFDVTVVVDDGARFAIVDSETDAQVGGTGDVRATVRNVGEETARDAVVSGSTTGSGVTLGSGGGSDVFVGDLAPGEERTVTFDSSVASTFTGETYVLRSTVEYRDRDGIETTSPTSRVGVTPVPEQAFAVDDVVGTLEVGHTGNVTGTITNDGPRELDDAVLVAESGSAGVTFGETRYALPELTSGESTEFTFDADVAPGSEPGPRQVRFTVEYESGDATATAGSSHRVEVAPGQSFTIDDVEGTLEVGYSGSIAGTIENDGPRTVDDAVLIAEPQSTRVTLGETRYALPDLASGEAADFSFDADVSGQADPGPRQVRFTVEYTDDDVTNTLTSTDRVEVTPRRPEFGVVSDGTSIPAGETRRITFEITNQRPETLSSINAALYADSPLTAVADEAFVDELAPGESAEIWFEVSVAGNAGERTYPIELDFRYDDERGNDRISDVTQYPIDVTEPVDDGDGLSPVAIGIGVVVLLAVVGAVWYRRYES